MMMMIINDDFLPELKTSPSGQPCSLGTPPIQRKNCLQSKGWACLVKVPCAVPSGHENSSFSSIRMELLAQSETSLIHRQPWLTWS